MLGGQLLQPLRVRDAHAAELTYTGEDADGNMQLEDLEGRITMRDLMKHTAGLGYTLNRRHPVNQA